MLVDYDMSMYVGSPIVNKCTTTVRDVDNERSYACVETWGYGKSLYLLLNFAVNLRQL